MQDLRLVFREDGDSGKKRMSQTPEPAKMMHNIDTFQNKWKAIKDIVREIVYSQRSPEGTCIHYRTPETQTASATSNLKRHIQCGCLSGIPTGAGTNKNERFHHHINSLFNRSKMGILLAYALLSVVIHWYNSTQRKHGKLISRPIGAATLASSQHNDLPILPVGITPKDRAAPSQQDDCYWEIDLSESTIDLHLVVDVYTVCIGKLRLVKNLMSMGLPNSKDITTNLTSFHPISTQFEQTVMQSHLLHSAQIRATICKCAW